MSQTINAQQNIQPRDVEIVVEERILKFNGDPVVKKYLKGKFLGKGGFAKCYEITNLESKKL